MSSPLIREERRARGDREMARPRSEFWPLSRKMNLSLRKVSKKQKQDWKQSV